MSVGEHTGMFNPEFLATDSNDGQDGNPLIQYLQIKFQLLQLRKLQLLLMLVQQRLYTTMLPLVLELLLHHTMHQLVILYLTLVWVIV